MLTYVLGAPGSGKTTVAPLLQDRLLTHVVIDWDAFMDAASGLVGRDVRKSPETWPSYRELVRAIVESIRAHSIVVLGVCAPVELSDWPIDATVLLDCTDQQRRQRLGAQGESHIKAAIADAREYRALGLPVVDTTDRSPQEVADALTQRIARR